MFLSKKTKNPLDRRRKVVSIKGTSELKTVEFNEFLEKIRLAALTKNVWPIKLDYPNDFSFNWSEEYDR